MNALLTDEAVQAARAPEKNSRPSRFVREAGFRDAIEHHRTEGREALVEAVAEAVAAEAWLTAQEAAEAVVTRLVGEKP